MFWQRESRRRCCCCGRVVDVDVICYVNSSCGGTAGIVVVLNAKEVVLRIACAVDAMEPGEHGFCGQRSCNKLLVEFEQLVAVYGAHWGL